MVTQEEVASHPDVDMVMAASVGKAGLRPIMAAIQAGKAVALANNTTTGDVLEEYERRSEIE